MKKTISLILALCLCVSLTACVSEPEPTAVPTTEPTVPTTVPPTDAPTAAPTESSATDPTEPSVNMEIYEIPMAAISLTEQTEVTFGKDSTTVFEYTYQNVRLILPDAEMALTVNLDILNRIDATKTTASDIMNDAVAANPQYPYYFSIVYEPQRMDTAVLSLFGRQTVYSGGSALNSGHGLTYDLATGSVLTLEDVLADGVTADTLCPLVINALAALPAETYLFDDYVTTVENRFSGDFLQDGSWHLAETGLCFTFAPYEVAPNSAGFVHAVIPYEQLTGILEDAWFPPEQVTPNGTLRVDTFSQEAADSIETFAEVNLDRGSDMYLLTTDGMIYDLVIESGIRRSNGFTPQATVFRANSLIPANAVTLQATADTLALLRITYTGAEGPVEVYLSIDENGNLQLS